MCKDKKAADWCAVRLAYCSTERVAMHERCCATCGEAYAAYAASGQWRKLLNRQHTQARAACNGRARSISCAKCNMSAQIGSTGGWCLISPKLIAGAGSYRHSGGPVHLPNNQTYVLPPHHYKANGGIGAILMHLLQNELADLPDLAEVGRQQSLNDFGAGVGQVIIASSCACFQDVQHQILGCIWGALAQRLCF